MEADFFSLVEGHKYIVAVSGGIDSVVLLHLLTRTYNLAPITFIVAHFDHGMRADSRSDREFVGELAAKYGLVFEYAEGHLGVEAGEETARLARYEFLKSAKAKYDADAIIMAHQQDEGLATAIINLIRGTGNRGLCSLRSTGSVIRPLLGISRSHIMDYAEKYSIEWREDSTNSGDRFLRNRIRHNLLPQMTDQQRAQMLMHIAVARGLADSIEGVVLPVVTEPDLSRGLLIGLDLRVRMEVVAAWLRLHVRGDFSKHDLERWGIQVVILPVGKKISLGRGAWLISNKKTVSISLGGGVPV